MSARPLSRSQLVHAETARGLGPLEFFLDSSYHGPRRRAVRRFSLQLGGQRFGLLDDHVELGLPVEPAVWHDHRYPAVDRRGRRRGLSADHTVLLRHDVRRVHRHADPFLPAVPATPPAAPDDQAGEQYQEREQARDDHDEDQYRSTQRAMPRLVLDKARRHAVRSLALGAEERLRCFVDRVVLRRQRGRQPAVLFGVKPRVNVRVIENVVLPYGQHLTVARLVDQETVEL